MTIYGWVIVAFWLILVVIWAIFGSRAKRTINSRWVWRRAIALRVAIVVLLLLAFRLSAFHYGLQNLQSHAVNRSPVAGVIGVVLCALGAGLAVLARIYLGRNWGIPMSRKENPDLVTSGPYSAIRHPIYTGMLLVILGSAIGQSIFWALALLVYGPYFVYSARREERIMTEQFPEQYPTYRKRTKMLLPYVL